MMQFKRSRSRPRVVLEALERRELMTVNYYNFNTPSPSTILPVPKSATVSVCAPDRREHAPTVDPRQ